MIIIIIKISLCSCRIFKKKKKILHEKTDMITIWLYYWYLLLYVQHIYMIIKTIYINKNKNKNRKYNSSLLYKSFY